MTDAADLITRASGNITSDPFDFEDMYDEEGKVYDLGITMGNDPEQQLNSQLPVYFVV